MLISLSVSLHVDPNRSFHHHYNSQQGIQTIANPDNLFSSFIPLPDILSVIHIYSPSVEGVQLYD